MATIDTIKEVLQDNLDIEPETVNEESTFESLGIDSLDMVEIIMDIEEEFDISIDTGEGLKTVSDLIEFIKKGK